MSLVRAELTVPVLKEQLEGGRLGEEGWGQPPGAASAPREGVSPSPSARGSARGAGRGCGRLGDGDSDKQPVLSHPLPQGRWQEPLNLCSPTKASSSRPPWLTERPGQGPRLGSHASWGHDAICALTPQAPQPRPPTLQSSGAPSPQPPPGSRLPCPLAWLPFRVLREGTVLADLTNGHRTSPVTPQGHT